MKVFPDGPLGGSLFLHHKLHASLYLRSTQFQSPDSQLQRPRLNGVRSYARHEQRCPTDGSRTWLVSHLRTIANAPVMRWHPLRSTHFRCEAVIVHFCRPGPLPCNWQAPLSQWQSSQTRIFDAVTTITLLQCPAGSTRTIDGSAGPRRKTTARSPHLIADLRPHAGFALLKPPVDCFASPNGKIPIFDISSIGFSCLDHRLNMLLR